MDPGEPSARAGEKGSRRERSHRLRQPAGEKVPGREQDPVWVRAGTELEEKFRPDPAFGVARITGREIAFSPKVVLPRRRGDPLAGAEASAA